MFLEDLDINEKSFMYVLKAIIIKLIFSSKAIFIDMHTNIVKKKNK